MLLPGCTHGHGSTDFRSAVWRILIEDSRRQDLVVSLSRACSAVRLTGFGFSLAQLCQPGTVLGRDSLGKYRYSRLFQ
jgi:hypothetical protein